MVEAIGCCMICRERCFSHVWLCQSCYDQWPQLHGKLSTWPEWARDLKNMHEAERIQERDALENEIELPTDLPDFLESMKEDDGCAD